MKLEGWVYTGGGVRAQAPKLMTSERQWSSPLHSQCREHPCHTLLRSLTLALFLSKETSRTHSPCLRRVKDPLGCVGTQTSKGAELVTVVPQSPETRGCCDF